MEASESVPKSAISCPAAASRSRSLSFRTKPAWSAPIAIFRAVYSPSGFGVLSSAGASSFLAFLAGALRGFFSPPSAGASVFFDGAFFGDMQRRLGAIDQVGLEARDLFAADTADAVSPGGMLHLEGGEIGRR